MHALIVLYIYCLFTLIQYLPGLSDALVEAIQMFCTVVKDLNSQKFISSEADNSSDIISAVSSELKEYGCKWVRNIKIHALLGRVIIF